MLVFKIIWNGKKADNKIGVGIKSNEKNTIIVIHYENSKSKKSIIWQNFKIQFNISTLSIHRYSLCLKWYLCWNKTTIKHSLIRKLRKTSEWEKLRKNSACTVDRMELFFDYERRRESKTFHEKQDWFAFMILRL